MYVKKDVIHLFYLSSVCFVLHITIIMKKCLKKKLAKFQEKQK